MVGHEEGIELASFQFLDQLLDVGEIEIGVGPGTGIAPRAGMNADRPHESAELELPLCHRPNPFWLSLRTKIGTAGRAAIAVRREDYFVFVQLRGEAVICDHRCVMKSRASLMKRRAHPGASVPRRLPHGRTALRRRDARGRSTA